MNFYLDNSIKPNRGAFMKKYTFYCFSIFFLLLSSLTAQERIEVEILSYEEMMKILVVTASKEAQKISDAPAIIDVLTEQQIKDFGVRDLYELISFLPGIEIAETFYGRTVLNFRGVQNLHYTNKVLLMVNGNQMYEPVTGAFFLETIPISSVSRVEVIRGPGSALYGTNAYSGVINIITKNAGSGSDMLSLLASYGSFNTVDAEAAAKVKLNETSGLFVAGGYTGTKGYPFNITADEKGQAMTFDYFNKPLRIFGNFVYENLNVDFGYTNIFKSQYGLTPVIDYIGDMDFRLFFANAKYSQKISEKVGISLTVRYNSFNNEKTNLGFFPAKGFGGHAVSTMFNTVSGSIFGAEAQFDIDLMDGINNISGLVFENFKSDPYLFKWEDDQSITPFTSYATSPSSTTFGAYTQFQASLADWYSFIVGIRLVKDSDVNDMYILPRAGIIFKLTEKHSFKVLYGKAFRAPTFFEKYVATNNVLYGSTALLPEEIQTLDVGLESEFSDNLSGRINFFYQKTSDGITRIPTTNPALTGARAAMFINSAKQDMYGLELQINGALTGNSYYGLNASWKTGSNILTAGDTDIVGIAHITANGWLSYKFDQVFFTPQLQFVGERKGYSGRLVNNVPVGDYTIDSYLLVNLTVGYHFSAFTLSVTGKNLLDKDYFYPEYVRNLSETVPGGPHRNFLATLRYDLN